MLGTCVVVAAVVVFLMFAGEDEQPIRTPLSVAEALTADTSGYARANRPRSFAFPTDHGPHPDFRTEWWYYTGILRGADDSQYGYQLTFFRTALTPPTPAVAFSGDTTLDRSWSTSQLYMGHFALTDVERSDFHSFERFSRGAAGLAGAAGDPYQVWLEDWRIEGPSADSVRLHASADGIVLDVSLRRMKPIVLQGEDGLDRKSKEPGNASYYYSMTRLQTSGRVIIGGEDISVEGLSWLDREWSTSALGVDQVGWDWFSLQLDDGRDVMYYRLRRRDGSSSPFSSGVVVGVDGAVSRLTSDNLRLDPTRFWESPVSGNRYPVEWSFRIPADNIDLVLTPFLDHQELRHTLTYWEGAVRARGSHSGTGYVEMTGYGDAPARSGGL